MVLNLDMVLIGSEQITQQLKINDSARYLEGLDFTESFIN